MTSLKLILELANTDVESSHRNTLTKFDHKLLKLNSGACFF